MTTPKPLPADPVAHQEAEQIARVYLSERPESASCMCVDCKLARAYLALLAQLREAEKDAKRFGVLSDEFQQSDSDQWAKNFIEYSTLARFADALEETK